MFINSRLLGGILSIALVLNTCTAEVFTALAEMEELLDTEAVLIANLISYVDAQEDKLNYLRRWVQMIIEMLISSSEFNFPFSKLFRRIREYQREHSEASADISAYLTNPINAYLLTKRLTSDWKTIEEVMAKDAGSGACILI